MIACVVWRVSRARPTSSSLCGRASYDDCTQRSDVCASRRTVATTFYVPILRAEAHSDAKNEPRNKRMAVGAGARDGAAPRARRFRRAPQHRRRALAARQGCAWRGRASARLWGPAAQRRRTSSSRRGYRSESRRRSALGGSEPPFPMPSSNTRRALTSATACRHA